MRMHRDHILSYDQHNVWVVRGGYFPPPRMDGMVYRWPNPRAYEAWIGRDEMDWCPIDMFLTREWNRHLDFELDPR